MRKRLWALIDCFETPETAQNRAEPRSVETLIPVLLISLSAAEMSDVRECLRGTRFLPVCADDLQQATRVLSQIIIPVVVYDPVPYAGEWETEIGRFARAWRRPMLLFLAGAGQPEFPQDSVFVRSPSLSWRRPVQSRSLIAALDGAYGKWSEGFANGRTECRAMAATSSVGFNGHCSPLSGCIVPSE